jgi:hypothetical protein
MTTDPAELREAESPTVTPADEILAYMEETAAVSCGILATARAQGNLTLHWLDVHRVCRQLSHLADTYVAMRAAGHRRD